MNDVNVSKCKLVTSWGLVVACWISLPAVAQNLEMGPTFEGLEARASRMITEFEDAQVVSRRTADGGLESILFSPDGEEMGVLTVDSAGQVAEARLSAVGGGARIDLGSVPAGSISYDWANLQLYSLWRDSRRIDLDWLPGHRLIEDGSFFRLPGSGSASSTRSIPGRDRARTLRLSERSVTTEFGDLVASSRASKAPLAGDGIEPFQDKEHHSATYTTHLVDRRTGRTLGLARYFETAQVYVWDFGDLSRGYASDATVPGGWTFEHNMAWSNVQAFGFWYFRQETEPKAGRRLGYTPIPGSPLNALGLKNSPGCDLLHHLDDTVYRECCDEHDKCYGYDPQSNEQTRDDPCSFWSWFFVEGWRCTQCNLDVLMCFLSTWADGDGGDRPRGDGGGDPCTVTGSAWCPAECFTCNRQAY